VVIQVEFYLNTYTRDVDVSNALNRFSYGGHVSDLASALRLVRTRVFTASNGARRGDPRVARLTVIFCVSRPTNVSGVLAESSTIRKAGVGIVTVGIGTGTDLYLLSAVASYPHQRTMFHVERVSRMSTISERIKRLVCRGIVYSASHFFTSLCNLFYVFAVCLRPIA